MIYLVALFWLGICLQHHNSSLIDETLKEALKHYVAPSLIHSDRGVEYLASSHQTILKIHGIKQSHSAAGQPWQNGFIERIFRSLKEELPSLKEVSSPEELFELINATIYYYNHHRYHSILKTTPYEYFKKINSPKPSKIPNAL